MIEVATKVDPETRQNTEIMWLARVYDITPQNARLLRHFCRHPGHALSMSALIYAVWPDHGRDEPESAKAMIQTGIRSIRGRLGDDAITVSRGIGYVLPHAIKLRIDQDIANHPSGTP